jgi:acetyl esterase/lipase
MNKNIYILILLFCLQIFPQTRYLDEVFTEYQKTEDVVYGNAPDLPFLFLFEWNTSDIDLDMDIYEPVGDTLEDRPVIIFIHTGAFFSGSNELDDVVDLSIASAKRGYVAVNINYRLGLNILSAYSGERAVYRGVQDGSAAIRYLREFHEEFNIDPDKIFIWGSSAGSLIGLHLANYQDDERPESTFGVGSDPDLGCIDCEGNDYVQNNRPNALVSCWGAIGDLDWIDSEDNIPTIMFHGTLDPIIPFNSGFPLLDIALPIVYGSNLIHERMDQLNIQNELYVGEGELHEYWGAVNGNWFSGPNEYYYQILDNSFNFLYQFLDIGSNELLGDINNDQIVNILDIIVMVDYVVNNQYISVADINADNIVNILDIILIVNIIIGDARE